MGIHQLFCSENATFRNTHTYMLTYRGVARILHWGAAKLSAKGARIEAPKALREMGIGEGCPPPQPTRGSGEAS